jgi:hypothetical protein
MTRKHKAILRKLGYYTRLRDKSFKKWASETDPTKLDSHAISHNRFNKLAIEQSELLKRYEAKGA